MITISHDRELFRLVLIYLYTRTFCFTTSTDIEADVDIPTTQDAEGIYKIAHDLKIMPLEAMALRFLEVTCVVSNIAARTFSEFAAAHPVVGNVYDTYFLKNWNKIIRLPGLEDLFNNTTDPTRSKRINLKYRKLTYQLGDL